MELWVWLYICGLFVLNLVTTSLGDSLAGLTVFSSNQEDPYITLKDTVSALHDYLKSDFSKVPIQVAVKA